MWILKICYRLVPVIPIYVIQQLSLRRLVMRAPARTLRKSKRVSLLVVLLHPRARAPPQKIRQKEFHRFRPAGAGVNTKPPSLFITHHFHRHHHLTHSSSFFPPPAFYHEGFWCFILKYSSSSFIRTSHYISSPKFLVCLSLHCFTKMYNTIHYESCRGFGGFEA